MPTHSKPQTQRPEWLIGLAIMAVVGLGYFVGAWLGVTQTISPDGNAIIWPPNAVALAALLLLPVRRWAWIIPAVMVAEIIADIPVFPPWAAVSFGLINLFEAFLAASLIRWLTGPRFDFDSLARGGYFLLFGPLLAAGIAALFGAGVYCGLAGEGSEYLAHWQLWWFGDALGLVLLTPLLVIVTRQYSEMFQAWTRRRLLEAGALLLLLGVMGMVLMATAAAEEPGHPLSLVLLLLPVLWAAARFGVLGAVALVALVAATAIAWTVHESWPLQDEDPEGTILALQQFLAVTATVGIGVGLLLDEIGTQRMRLRLFERTMESINDAVIITDARRHDDPIIWVNDTFETLFGYSRDEAIGRNCRFLQHGDDHQEGVREVRDALRRQQPVRTLVRNYRRDGQPLWIELSLAPVSDSHGRVTHFVGVQHDLTELKRAEEELEHRVAERTQALQEANARLTQQAATDWLTGAANRRQLMRQARRELARAQRNGTPLSLLCLDLDHFKTVNDVHGHQVGDQVLKQVASTMQQNLRPSDLLARVGGEEFQVLLPDADNQQAGEIAERIRSALHDLEIKLNDKVLKITVSVGCAQMGQDGKDIDSLMRVGDQRLYEAKALGRDRVVTG
ncbi:sensor domain-containing diguanylate cyclase [Halomonas daqiaonensis]|uniref:PAS domain S-box-containing protein/diguanylate cyclase (GGDEF) domain-containing protein n=1 Tax=Halomonas daqiaonensis TaxID=650850 RepID=A0A1H7NZY8_9GAMM|nr:sensor domain-containing diguanylate cyclase [Halomonas daqiaonensis]SEL28407.1 PAS domain S-box-containing protein/diguanylate cyclase (GGDEF) domain-containing protein [Halomonas daqiaonensis]